MFIRFKKPATAIGLTLTVGLANGIQPVLAIQKLSATSLDPASPKQQVLAPAQRPLTAQPAPRHLAQTASQPTSTEPQDDPSAFSPSGSTAPHSLDTLSAEAQRTARVLGLWDALSHFDALRQQKEAGKLSSTEYLEARQDLVVNLMIVSQDVRSFVHFLEEEIAKADSINAMIAARRDRALKLNTYGDLISGGISGIIGGGLQLADINHISYDTIDTVEGAIQTALAIMSLREQRGEKRIERGIPNILSRLFEPEKGPSSAYPTSVWKFLNAPSSARPNAETRREKLINEWNKNGFCISHQHIHRRPPKAMGERRERLLNCSTQNYRATAELIEDRTAMLHQLRSTVTRLDVIMLELLLYMRSTSLASGSPTT